LPQQGIPLALLFFNVGVEVGQFLFIAAVSAEGTGHGGRLCGVRCAPRSLAAGCNTLTVD
jgi:hypothetical protein